MQVIVHTDGEHLAQAAAGLITEAINGSPGPSFTLGLAGGSTPIATYRRLRDANADWQSVDAWMSDERWVPLDHPECNGLQAAEELVEYVQCRFHRPRYAEWLAPADSAAHYEAVLRSLHPDGRADLVLLGIGADGHTASLFPGTSALDAPPGRWFVDNYVPHLDAHRLTATLPFLRAARRILFLVTGEGKAAALKEILEPAPGSDPLPAAGVLGGDAAVTWLVDEEAASQLGSTPVLAAE